MGARNKRPDKDRTHKHRGHPQIRRIKSIGQGPMEVILWSWGSPTQNARTNKPKTKQAPNKDNHVRLASMGGEQITHENTEIICARGRGGQGGGMFVSFVCCLSLFLAPFYLLPKLAVRFAAFLYQSRDLYLAVGRSNLRLVL